MHPRLEGAPLEVECSIGTLPYVPIEIFFAEFRRYKTGSYGWMAAGKMPCPGVPGERVQVNIQLTVIGSKEWSEPGQLELPETE